MSGRMGWTAEGRGLLTGDWIPGFSDRWLRLLCSAGFVSRAFRLELPPSRYGSV